MRLEEAVEKYSVQKRADGAAFVNGTNTLRSFCRHSNNQSLNRISVRHVIRFLNASGTSTLAWRIKYSVLRNFFEFWSARGEMAWIELPPPPALLPQKFVPYIYSRDDILKLLRAIREYPVHPNQIIGPQTMSTLIIILYGTGALVGEILRLSANDVDLKTGLIVIRGRGFNRFRRLPIGPDLRYVLKRYVNWKRRKGIEGRSFFVTNEGASPQPALVCVYFRRIRQMAGVLRNDGATYQPRLHDLRSTFAVHRISRWIKSGADMNRMLPALSAYIGQVGLASTERFLLMTPERFQKELNQLSPMRAKRHWRKDAALMRYLADL